MAVITGRLDVTTLAPVRGFPGAYLLAPVEASWQAVCDEVQRRHGWRPTLTSAGDAYRSYAIQERIFRQRYTPDRVTGIDPRWWAGRLWWRLPGVAAAAVPGTSNHGRGDTVDVASLAYGTRRFEQFAAVATAHGWSNVEGRAVGEAWHWTKTSPGNPDPDPMEDDMTPEQAKLLGEIHWMLSQVRGTDLPPIATHAKAAHAAGDLTVAATTNITNGVTALLGRAPGTVDAAAIVDLLDDDLARAVADEIDRRARARLA